MHFKNIINPNTNETFSIKSLKGQQLLLNFLNNFKGGAQKEDKDIKEFKERLAKLKDAPATKDTAPATKDTSPPTNDNLLNRLENLKISKKIKSNDDKQLDFSDLDTRVKKIINIRKQIEDDNYYKNYTKKELKNQLKLCYDICHNRIKTLKNEIIQLKKDRNIHQYKDDTKEDDTEEESAKYQDDYVPPFTETDWHRRHQQQQRNPLSDTASNISEIPQMWASDDTFYSDEVLSNEDSEDSEDSEDVHEAADRRNISEITPMRQTYITRNDLEDTRGIRPNRERYRQALLHTRRARLARAEEAERNQTARSPTDNNRITDNDSERTITDDSERTITDNDSERTISDNDSERTISDNDSTEPLPFLPPASYRDLEHPSDDNDQVGGCIIGGYRFN